MPSDKSLPKPDPELEKPNPELPKPEKDLPLPEKEIPAKNTDGIKSGFPIYKSFIFGFIFILFISLLGVIFFLYQGQKSSGNETTMEQNINPPIKYQEFNKTYEITDSNTKPGWQTLTNYEDGYAVDFPPGWHANSDHQIYNYDIATTTPSDNPHGFPEGRGKFEISKLSTTNRPIDPSPEPGYENMSISKTKVTIDGINGIRNHSWLYTPNSGTTALFTNIQNGDYTYSLAGYYNQADFDVFSKDYDEISSTFRFIDSEHAKMIEDLDQLPSKSDYYNLRPFRAYEEYSIALYNGGSLYLKKVNDKLEILFIVESSNFPADPTPLCSEVEKHNIPEELYVECVERYGLENAHLEHINYELPNGWTASLNNGQLLISTFDSGHIAIRSYDYDGKTDIKDAYCNTYSCNPNPKFTSTSIGDITGFKLDTGDDARFVERDYFGVKDDKIYITSVFYTISPNNKLEKGYQSVLDSLEF